MFPAFRKYITNYILSFNIFNSVMHAFKLEYNTHLSYKFYKNTLTSFNYFDCR